MLQRMSSDAASCLQRTWPLIVQLVIEIGCLVSLMRPLAKPEHQRVLRLVRLAEGLMRRWLVLSACARPLKDPGPMGERGGYTGVPAGLSQGLGLPLFRLAVMFIASCRNKWRLATRLLAGAARIHSLRKSLNSIISAPLKRRKWSSRWSMPKAKLSLMRVLIHWF